MKKYLAAAAAFFAVPGVAAAQEAQPAPAADLGGLRVEARVGWETPTVSEDGEVYKIESDVSWGGEVGFDLALGGNVVAGPYANYEFSNVNLCDGADCIVEDGHLGAGVRVGVGVGGGTLIYGKVGYSKITFTATAAGLSGSDSGDGLQGAIGANFSIGGKLYALVEANYADYGDFNGINLQRRHVAAGVGIRF